MSREIKFRAWDGGVMSFWTLHELTKINWEMSSPLIGTIMQYTGLKDKNGVEIYEGDIVNHKRPPHELKKGDVRWLGIEAKFYISAVDTFSTWGILTSSTFEVIGNIYENKELLE